MPFPNDFPYTNFHELNLDYFIKKFDEIFTEWANLYETLTTWKSDTDNDITEWKNDAISDITAWENEVFDELNAWKRETGSDIDEWERGVISDLNDWKDGFENEYEALADRVTAIVSDTEDMVENLAEPFSSSNNYSVGDYVIYNGVLYRFTSNHSAGDWDSSEVVQTTAMNDINDINNIINVLFEEDSTPEIKVGRLGTSSGTNDTILWCARTKTLTEIPNKSTEIRVSCEGYLIRVLMYSNNALNSSNPTLWYNSQYEEGPIQYKIVESANYYGLNIRKSPSGETDLTNEDLEDISSKLKIYFNNAISNVQELLNEEISERKQNDETILDNLIINNLVGNLNIVSGRLGTAGGANDTILWCARTNELQPFIDNPTLISVECQGYYVRLLQYQNDTIGGGNIPVSYTSAFMENSIVASVSDSARYYGINIRKNMDDSYVMTTEDIADISNKLIVKNNSAENKNTLILDAKYGHGGIGFFPNPFYPSEYTAELIEEFGTSNTSTQGMCGDGHRYVWISGRLNNSDNVNCTIYKYDIINKTLVKKISEREYGHANDMAFVPDTNEIHIIAWKTDDSVLYENGGTVDRICVIDADSLLYKYSYGLNDIIGSNAGYYRLSAIAYNPGLRQFAGLLSAHEVDNESVRSLVRWTLTGDYIDHKDGLPTGTASGMDYDNNYIYLLLAYRLYYFDLQYNLIGNTTYRLPYSWNDGTQHIQEAESLSVFYDAIYMNTNNLNDPDLNPETRLYKLTPLKVSFITLT